MRALHPVIQKLQIHHLLTHLILTWILLTNTNHTTRQVDQDTRNIESIRKIEDLDHQALIVQYHSTVNIENINITVQNITKSINILSIQSNEQCKADNGIYNRDRESGIRYDLGRQDLYSTNDRDQYRYNMDGYWNRDARNSYDQDICRDYCRSERDQSRREKYYGYHQEASSSESQYYAHSRYLTQSESYRHSQMTSHEQRQNEYEYKHYPVTQQRDNHSHSRYYSQQDSCRHLVSRPFSYSQTAGSQPTAYFHTKRICDKSLLTADSLEQTQSTTDSFNQSRVYHSNQIIDMTTSQLGGSSQSDGSWSSASFHYQIGQGGSLQHDGSQSSANVHSQIASSQSTAQFHNHADSSQQEACPFIQLTNDAFIPIDHSLSPSELRTLKDKLLNAEQGLLDAKNKYFNNLTECERKFKEHVRMRSQNSTNMHKGNCYKQGKG